MSDKPSVIGFERIHNQVGDCVISIKALYAISILYPQSKLIVFTSKMGANLFQNYPFINKIVVINSDENEKSNFYNALLEHKIDILLLLHRTSWKIKVAKLSKIPKVITELHMHTLFSKNFKSPLIHISYFVHGSQKILKLVRQIDTKHYDKNISKIDFSMAKLPTTQTNQTRINNFLESCRASAGESYDKIIGINPFGKANMTSFNFTLQDWSYLIESLSKKFPQILFIITTYAQNPLSIEISACENVKIFCNDEDILNLVELTKHFDLLLSVNTGNIHIADNLEIPMLVINKSKERYNCIGGSYGGKFEGIYLPKNYHRQYQLYFEQFYKKAEKMILELLQY